MKTYIVKHVNVIQAALIVCCSGGVPEQLDLGIRMYMVWY